jgi:hypothetical protein
MQFGVEGPMPVRCCAMWSLSRYNSRGGSQNERTVISAVLRKEKPGMPSRHSLPHPTRLLLCERSYQTNSHKLHKGDHDQQQTSLTPLQLPTISRPNSGRVEWRKSKSKSVSNSPNTSVPSPSPPLLTHNAGSSLLSLTSV